jgi:hypothetical protein
LNENTANTNIRTISGELDRNNAKVSLPTEDNKQFIYMNFNSDTEQQQKQKTDPNTG